MNTESNSPVLTEIREGSRFMRSVASFVIFIFSFVMYSPSVLAVVHSEMPERQQTAKERLESSFDVRIEKFEQALEQFNRVLKQQNTERLVSAHSWVSQLKGSITQDALSDARQQVIDAWQGVDATKTQMLETREQIEQRLKRIEKTELRDKLVNKVLANQQATVEKYQGLAEKVEAIKQSESMPSLKKAAYNALRYVSQHNPEQPVHIYNAGEMPFGVTSDASRSPYTTAESLHSYLGLEYDPELDHAETGFNYFTDFQSTDDIQKNHPDIQALATELGKDAETIYQWVYNNIYYIPSFGSIQGDVQTLHNRQGNALDIASLLISLLRASNVAARYVYGTVVLPANQINNWVGGVDDIQSARVIMAQGGIPGSAISEGGQYEKLRFEHVWVEAHGNFNAEGDYRWNPMDAAFKQYTYTDGVDLLSEVGFDAEQFQDTVENAGTVNEAEGWIANVDTTDMQAELTQYQDAIQTYLGNLPDDTTLAQVIGGQTINELTEATIPPLAYEEYVRTRSFSALPNNIRHAFRLDLATQPIGLGGALGGGGTNLLQFERSLPELAGKELALSFRPATVVDEETISALFDGVENLEDIPTELDAGLFNVVAEITVDGEVVESSNPIAFGTQLATHKGFIDPRFGYRNTTSPITAGDYQAIGIDLQGVTVEQMQSIQTDLESVQAQLQEENFDGLTRHDITGGIVQAGIVAYFAMNDVMTKLAAKMNGLVHYRMPSFGTFSTHSSVTAYWGAANSVSLGGMAMDVDWLMANNEGKVNCWQDWVSFNQMTGQMASAYEHVIPEQLLSTEELPVEFVSTMKALQIANAEGQRIYTINRDNINTLLPQIETTSQIINDIQAAVLNGDTAIIHERPIEYQDYVGSGYMLIDPDTGTGAYKISGGGNGALSGKAFGMGLILAAVSMMMMLGVFLMPALLAAFPALMAIWGISAGVMEFQFRQDSNARTCFWAGFFMGFMSAGVLIGGWAQLARVLPIRKPGIDELLPYLWTLIGVPPSIYNISTGLESCIGGE